MLDQAFFSAIGKFAVSFSNVDYTIAHHQRLVLRLGHGRALCCREGGARFNITA